MIASALFRRALLALFDVACWGAATIMVIGARYDFVMSDIAWTSAGRYLLIVAVVSVSVGYLTKLYRGLYRVGSFEEAIGVAALFTFVGIFALAVTLLTDPAMPRGILLLVPPTALLVAAFGRWVYRVLRDRRDNDPVDDARRVLVYGAGDAGYQLMRLLQANGQDQYEVVGLIDDNPGKAFLRIGGVQVLGGRRDLARVAARTGADAVILAIPSATGQLIGDIERDVASAGLEFFVISSLTEIVGGRVDIGHIRRVTIDDILGRHQVHTDVSQIASYLSGKRVLITGAGGSIGSELSRQVHDIGPSDLALLYRDESALHAVQLSIYRQGLLTTGETVLCDIRDREALREAFETHRPEIVFHAAALKHLPMLERFPDEGWKTNVLGTLNVLEVAREFGVKHFVNISTDKAADATSVLGYTKRLAERLTSWQGKRSEGTYISVRFGNVLGSRGSMFHAFTTQIESGGPVTVTHPDITRYFMTIPEACELVIQAGYVGRAGEAMVLDMGSPVKILDVAKRMIAMSGKGDIPITFTGLRPGEKLHEVLFGVDEKPRPTSHPLIRSVEVEPLDPEGLASFELVRSFKSE